MAVPLHFSNQHLSNASSQCKKYSNTVPRHKLQSLNTANMTAHDFANGWQGSLRLPTKDTPTPPRSPSLAATTRGGIVVFSGGSAANNLVDVFDEIREANQNALSYVIPISDNGGSSSELIRVFGGPGTYSCHAQLKRSSACE